MKIFEYRRLASWMLAAIPLLASARPVDSAPAHPIGLAVTPRIVTVSPVVGDPFASGVALRNAYSGVTDATAEDPVVIRLEPGTYDVGRVAFTLDKPHVNLEGSGREVTVVKGVLYISVDATVCRLAIEHANGLGVLAVAGRVYFRELSVTVSGETAGDFPVGVELAFAALGRLEDVVVAATNPNGPAVGVDLSSSSSSPNEPFVLDRVEIKATSGYQATGLSVGANALINNVHIDSSLIGLSVIATGAVPPVVKITNTRIDGATQLGIMAGSSGASTVVVQNSTIGGSVRSITSWSLSQMDTRVAHSLISGPVDAQLPNTLACIGAYNASFQPLNATCQ